MSCSEFWKQELAGRLQGATFIAPGQVDGAVRCNREGCSELVRRDTQCCLRGHSQAGGDAGRGVQTEFQALGCVIGTLPPIVQALAPLRQVLADQEEPAADWPVRMEQALAVVAGEPLLDGDPRVQAARAFVTDWRRARGEEPRPEHDVLERWKIIPYLTRDEQSYLTRVTRDDERRRKRRKVPPPPEQIEQLAGEGKFRVGEHTVDLNAHTCTCCQHVAPGPQAQGHRCIHMLKVSDHMRRGGPGPVASSRLDEWLHFAWPLPAAAAKVKEDLDSLAQHVSAEDYAAHPEWVRAAAVRLALLVAEMQGQPEQAGARSQALHVLETCLRGVGETEAADRAAAERTALDLQTRHERVRAFATAPFGGKYPSGQVPPWPRPDSWMEGPYKVHIYPNRHYEDAGHTVVCEGAVVEVYDTFRGKGWNRAGIGVSSAAEITDEAIVALEQEVGAMCPHTHMDEVTPTAELLEGRRLYAMEHLWRCPDCGLVRIVDSSD